MALPGGLLDRPHVGVGKPKVMADFMDEDMGDDGTERFLVLRPEFEDRAAVEPDHIGKLSSHRSRFGLGAGAAAKQAQKVEFALAVHVIERLVIGEILDPDHKALADAAEFFWQRCESRLSHEVEIGDRRCEDIIPVVF